MYGHSILNPQCTLSPSKSCYFIRDLLHSSFRFQISDPKEKQKAAARAQQQKKEAAAKTQQSRIESTELNHGIVSIIR